MIPFPRKHKWERARNSHKTFVKETGRIPNYFSEYHCTQCGGRKVQLKWFVKQHYPVTYYRDLFGPWAMRLRIPSCNYQPPIGA